MLNSKKIIEMVGHGPAMNEIDRQFLNSVKKRYQDWTISADDPLTDLLFRAHGISQIGERFIEIHQAGEFLACSEEALNDLKNAEQWELTPEDQEKLADIRYEILGKKSHALIENGKREKNDKKRDDYFQESIIICRNCLKELQQKTDEDDALFNRQMQFYDILSRALLELGQKEECFQVCMEGFEFAKKISPSRHLKIQKTRLTLIYNCALRAFTSNKKDEGRLLFIELKQICQEGLEYLLSDKNLLKTDESYLEAREVFFKNHHLALHGLYYLCIDRNDEKNRDLIQSLIDDKRKLFKDWEEEDRKNGIRKNNTREYVWIELVKWKMEFFHKWEPNSHRNSIEARNAETELKQAISKAREVADSEPAKFSTLHGYLDILTFYSFILVKDINKLQDDINKRKDDIEKLKREKKAKEKEALQLYQTTKSLCIPWLQLENQYAESYLKNAFDHIMVFHANDFNHMEMVRELEQRISLKLHENDVTWFKMRLAEEYKLSGNLQNAAKTAREVREDPKYAEEASRFLSELIKN